MQGRLRNSHKLRRLSYVAARYLNNFDPTNNLLLCCMPRGGSTWLTQILHRVTRLPVLWEPLHPGRVPDLANLGTTSEQLVPEDAEWEALERYFLSMLKGKVLNSWCCEMSHPAEFLFARQMIVKFCRVNGMLPWLTRKFEFKKKPILLLRHPFSVAASQLQHPGFQNLEGGLALSNAHHSDMISKHQKMIDNLGSVAERQVFVWCLVNTVPLKSARHNKDWMTVFYEDLLEHPDKELKRIGEGWGLDIGVDDLEMVYKPSRTTIGKKNFRDAESQLSSWRSRFSESEVRAMQHILDYFEVEEYGTSIRPLKSSPYA